MLYVHIICGINVSLCVREAKQSTERKRSYGSPLVSIVEREEAECREGLEPDGAERTTNSPNSTTDKIEVHGITVMLLLNIEPKLIVVTPSHLLK